MYMHTTHICIYMYTLLYIYTSWKTTTNTNDPQGMGQSPAHSGEPQHMHRPIPDLSRSSDCCVPSTSLFWAGISITFFILLFSSIYACLSHCRCLLGLSEVLVACAHSSPEGEEPYLKDLRIISCTWTCLDDQIPLEKTLNIPGEGMSTLFL